MKICAGSYFNCSMVCVVNAVGMWSEMFVVPLRSLVLWCRKVVCICRCSQPHEFVHTLFSKRDQCSGRSVGNDLTRDLVMTKQ